jgi:hypothetical protein
MVNEFSADFANPGVTLICETRETIYVISGITNAE